MLMRNKKIIPPVASRYAGEVRHKLGRHVRGIILFGSHARGDAANSSDYDFIVILDKYDRSLREAVVDAGTDMLNEADTLCAALVYGADQWARVKESPLGWNVQKEGIEL